MPMYEFQCSDCLKADNVFRRVESRDDSHVCTRCSSTRTRRVVFPHQFIQADIEPYRAMGPERPWITSRAQHREYLYKHGYEEVGNDPSFAPPMDDEEPHPSEKAREMEDSFKTDLGLAESVEAA